MNGHLHITREEAIAQGFMVDTYRYPWVAYKGPTFDPDEWHTIITPAYDPQSVDA